MALKTLAISVGDNCIDRYLPPIELDCVGGNALNVAVSMQKAGLPSAYVGAVGNDEQGMRILGSAAGQGVDISHVQVLPGQTSQTDIQLTPAGDRIFVHETFGPVKQLSLDDASLRFIKKHRLVHSTFLGAAEEYLPEFRKGGGLLAFDYSERFNADFLEQTVAHVDLAFFSLPEDRAALAADMAAEIYGRGPRLVVFTMGLGGSLAFDGRIYRQPAIKVEVVDTLGAGDSFIGVFLASYMKKRTLETCLQEAALSAAQTCTHYGAWR